jgi:anaphase-promoting complex subunit 7
LNLNKIKDALIAAKEANARLSGNASAVVLLGQVLASEETTDNDKERAKTLFTKALAHDTNCIDAYIALADLHSNSGKYDQAAKVLKSGLSRHQIDSLYIKLADVLSCAKQFDEALGFYHTALALSPKSEAAKIGLERLEKLMRGIDPDREQEDNESDAEGDSSEVDASLESAQFS